MRSIISTLIIIIAACFFTSCKKCQTCEVKDTIGTVYYTKSACGNKKTLDDEVNKCSTAATQYSNSSCTCTED